MFDAEGTKGVVKVIDFGASQYVQAEETITDAFGTVRYSSPEMAADSGIGQKTDVWSVGALMYFMLSGTAPFLKKDDIDTLNYIKKKPKAREKRTLWGWQNAFAEGFALTLSTPASALGPCIQVKFAGKRWASISPMAKDCIQAMLEVDPERRPTSQQVWREEV